MMTRPPRIALALAAAALSAAVGALAWPQARDAALLLRARDDPARLSDLGVDSALRNDGRGDERKVTAGARCGDADLARSFQDAGRGNAASRAAPRKISPGGRRGGCGELDARPRASALRHGGWLSPGRVLPTSQLREPWPASCSCSGHLRRGA